MAEGCKDEKGFRDHTDVQFAIFYKRVYAVRGKAVVSQLGNDRC